MDDPIRHYWQLRLEGVKAVLEENRFEVFLAQDAPAAVALVCDRILPALPARTLAWGGSLSCIQSGLYERLKGDARYETLDTYDKTLAPEALMALRRRGLLADCFLTGTNALTEAGHLVNLDMIGNRVAAITFGPRYVILIVGRNKIVTDLEEAMARIKTYAAPVNAMRLDKQTPCAKSGVCHDCQSPERICNHWAITEKSYPGGRIKIVLVNAELGF
jgi:hypothetical protein